MQQLACHLSALASPKSCPRLRSDKLREREKERATVRAGRRNNATKVNGFGNDYEAASKAPPPHRRTSPTYNIVDEWAAVTR
ncbi:hypothetical protein HPB50_000716 [Hyalomma asiaticum]|uniref:Uncharacterized protein n=1 Tax=Hyalomma asiaticum TaxID=266040 RepID=A0ACB7SU56_HYAAI|nr:hypothetical protein HPB50_000716 [Hyalomma asiaticum]